MPREPQVPESDAPFGWSEPRIERLLRWFLAAELPVALSDAAPSDTSLLSPRDIGLGPSSRDAAVRSGRWLLLCCAAALLACLGIICQRPPRIPAADASRDRPTIIEVESSSLPVVVERVSYAGAQNSFEQRSELRWISQSYFEPDSGVWVEWTAPELAIDVETISAAGGDAQ